MQGSSGAQAKVPFCCFFEEVNISISVFGLLLWSHIHIVVKPQHVWKADLVCVGQPEK